MEERVKMMSTLTFVNVRLVTLAACARPVQSGLLCIHHYILIIYFKHLYKTYFKKHTNIICYPNYNGTLKVIKQTSRDVAITSCIINTIYLCPNSFYSNHTCSTYSNQLL